MAGVEEAAEVEEVQEQEEPLGIGVVQEVGEEGAGLEVGG